MSLLSSRPAGLASFRRRALFAAILAASLCPISSVRAGDLEIHGTQAAAIEIPNIYGVVRRPGDNSGGPLDQNGDSSYAFQAYLDTGTSGIILSYEDTDFREVEAQLDASGNPVVFGDIAIGGLVEYHVSEVLDLRLGRYTAESFFDVFTPAETNAYFNQVTPAIRAQLSTTPADPFFGNPLNLVGMPALKDKVMVVDSRLYNHLAGIDETTLEVTYNGGIEDLVDFPSGAGEAPFPQLQTWVHDRGTQTDRSKTSLFDPGVPVGQHVVRMSYADFTRFTTLTPANAIAPTLAHNPFVGPAPFTTPQPGDPEGITIKRGEGDAELSATGSWIFDTGAQVSFMSSAMALSIGVELTFDAAGNPRLTDLATGGAPAGLFEVAVGGASGGVGTLLGFTVDELLLPTTDGIITFHDVPILVLDVTVSDGDTTYTLDGDFGMNLLLPSMATDASATTASAFDFISFDEATGLLTLTDITAVPEPTSLAMLGGVAVVLIRRRR